MAKITDPDNLDRFQCAVDPIAETISFRGLGTERHAVDETGSGIGTIVFTDGGANFTSDGVLVGDIVTIISDPADDGGIIGHYRVTGAIGTTTLEVDRTVPTSSAADLTYKINAPQTTGAVGEQVADGVNMQALFSFLKEEYITLAAGLGNAVDLNRFDFPIVTISSAAGQYILGGVNGDAASAWSFQDINGVQASDTEGTTRELVRDAGWQERNATGVVLREYANYSTLGSLDTDAQGYFQQGDATGTPTDFKLTGPVNQAVLTLGPDSGPFADTDFAATTITRPSGDWTAENFRLGDFVTIRAAADGPNIGTFGPITTLTATIITIASASFTVNAADSTAIHQVDHRRFTKLHARKKGRTTTSALHIDGGVPTTGILPLINKFPLSHAPDPAITIDDGILSGGDATTEGDIFQQTETHSSAADGATVDQLDGTFTFASAGSTFNSTARSSVEVLLPGDSLAITSGSYQGVYEIVSVDDANTLTCFHEPLRTYPGDETTLSFTARAGVQDVGHTNAVLDDVDGLTGTLTSATSTFDVDTAIGDREVFADDIVEVFSGDATVIGYYKVISVAATILTLNTSDQIFAGETAQSYRVWRPGMFLQRFETTAVAAGMASMAFDGAGNPDTMTRDAGSYITDGFLAGMAITIVDAEDPANIATYIIAGTPIALVATLIDEESLTTNADDTTAINGNVTGDTGITRTINSVTYPFHWRLFAHGATLLQAFQFISRELRRATDIDGGSGTERGDITDPLMTFVSPNGVTLDMFPDNLSGSELNNVTYNDISGEARNNAFLVGLTFDVNANVISSDNSRLTAYFTSVPTGDFGSNTAVIVEDEAASPMDFTAIAVDPTATYDYTNNAQGGRTPDTDAAITVVALGDNLAQHILTTALIQKVNSLVVSVQPGLERDYQT